ncbi:MULTISPECIES: hypothetical protein [unclassified Paenibacillus]|uniref:hypothetical protein n=1 Tax=unclassified Paenibacillus TaxID=185978 RepID=UPI000709C23C|nr:hypothetical protein ASD40_20880 [Paenibacillus sp. Root444D2]KRE45726.1 hypothetical protein ASG85_06800 [Paenibacillus sp. Soil724D2]
MSTLFKKAKARVGVMTVGHEPYWAQFPGLKEELEGYGREFEEMLRKHDVEVVSAGFVDGVDKSFAASSYLKSQDVDFLFCFLSTYVTSSTAATPILNLSEMAIFVTDLELINLVSDRTARAAQIFLGALPILLLYPFL